MNPFNSFIYSSRSEGSWTTLAFAANILPITEHFFYCHNIIVNRGHSVNMSLNNFKIHLLVNAVIFNEIKTIYSQKKMRTHVNVVKSSMSHNPRHVKKRIHRFNVLWIQLKIQIWRKAAAANLLFQMTAALHTTTCSVMLGIPKLLFPHWNSLSGSWTGGVVWPAPQRKESSNTRWSDSHSELWLFDHRTAALLTLLKSSLITWKPKQWRLKKLTSFSLKNTWRLFLATMNWYFFFFHSPTIALMIIFFPGQSFDVSLSDSVYFCFDSSKNDSAPMLSLFSGAWTVHHGAESMHQWRLHTDLL